MTAPMLETARRISILERGGVPAATPGAVGGIAQVIGISGPPGAGKSALVGQLARVAVSTGCRIAILAVDPSSPLSGGAVLADRIRLPVDIPGSQVFFRSLASRGALGGLSRIVPAAIGVLEEEGYRLILVETVGVGQNETEIMDVADTVVLVQAPGAGDEVQGLKAGILEIADIFVVNKMDLPDAARSLRTVREVADARGRSDRPPEVLPTIAVEGDGIEELWNAINGHVAWLRQSGRDAERRTTRIKSQLAWLLWTRLVERLPIEVMASHVAEGRLSLEQAAIRIEGDMAGGSIGTVKAGQE